jgi:hypothetical protein
MSGGFRYSGAELTIRGNRQRMKKITITALAVITTMI